jgi:deoxyribodipyrimidine photo-lyase
VEEINIFWFRRDLRFEDNVALYHALNSTYKVLPIFIFDTSILDDLKQSQTTLDKRIIFIYNAIVELKKKCVLLQSDLLVFYGNILHVWQNLISNYNIKNVYANHDYEPYAINRDKQVSDLLLKHQIQMHTYKDQVIFEKSEILTDAQKPYTIYTPYAKKWKSKCNDFDIKSYPSENFLHQLCKTKNIQNLIKLQTLGFKHTAILFPLNNIEDNILLDYEKNRDFPSINGTSKLGVHLRFGTISIRKLVQYCLSLKAEKYLNELIWREFYMQILFHFPHVVHQSFKANYDNIQWRNNVAEFEAWCNGTTGYPIVDAGMRELNQTGCMHNRVRMIVASFLCKHLLIDWRWGEAYFAKKLLDFELASNNGGWQWCAGSGVDAAPYFRIFNPSTQTQKFDKQLEYINKWIPEINTLAYPTPIVEHTFARNRCLETYSKALK